MTKLFTHQLYIIKNRDFNNLEVCETMMMKKNCHSINIFKDAGLNSTHTVRSLGDMLKENKSLIDKMRIRTRPLAREVL